MVGDDEVNIVLDDFEQRVVVKGLSDFRNSLIRNEKPTEEIDEVLLKIIDAPRSKNRRRIDREVR